MITLLQWILFGALIGWIASVFKLPPNGQRAAGNLVAGIVGAVAGGWLSTLSDVRAALGVSSFATAFLGSFLLLTIVNVWPRIHSR